MKKFKFRDRFFECGIRTRLMGILNVTPDSFSDGGSFTDTERAVDHAIEMINNGAEIIDIGGESTRPGAPEIDEKEELNRILPVVKELKKRAPESIISIDTTKAEVASATLAEGADIINDVSGLQRDPEIANIAAKYRAGLIIMHMRGTPATMKQLTNYDNMLCEVRTFLENSANIATLRGVKKENIMIDPGIGFAKNTQQNIEIIREIAKFAESSYPLLVGPSRKNFIGDILEEPNPEKRLWGTAATVAYLAMQKVDLIRVHDVKEMREVIQVFERLKGL